MRLSGSVLLTVVLSCLIGGSAEARPPLRGVGNAYIIGVKPDQVKSSQAAADDIAARSHGIVGRVWEGVHAFEIEIDDAEAARISALPFVDYVEMDREIPLLDTARENAKAGSLTADAGLVSVFGWHPTPLFASACAFTQTSTPSADRTLGWGLDRIDARKGLDSFYHYGNNDGTGVDLFIVATGIRATHMDFQLRNGRARIVGGHSSVNDGHGLDDCDGFGTRVASFAAGDYAGVAKGANIIPVKVAACGKIWTLSDATDGFNWIATQRDSTRPQVVYSGFWWDEGINGSGSSVKSAVRSLIAQGFFVVTNAGHQQFLNQICAAANIAPGNATGAFNVGASAKSDAFGFDTCLGSEITMFAPGEGITGAGINYDQEYNGSPGWSSAPYAGGYVGGAAAVAAQWLWQKNARVPRADEIRAALLSSATRGALTVAPANLQIATASPNVLLYTRDWEESFPVACSATPDPGTTSCPVDSLAPAGSTYSSTGGTAQFNVAAPDGCSWAASVDSASASWLHLFSCASGGSGNVFGSGHGTVCIQVDPNLTPNNPNDPTSGSGSRAGKITVNQKIFFVNQNGVKAPVCPVDSLNHPTFSIRGPSTLKPGQNLVLTAYPGAGFTYRWYGGPSYTLINSIGPQIFIRPDSGFYPQSNTPTTYSVTAYSAACPNGVSVSFTVTVSGVASTCPLTLTDGPGIIASPGPGYPVSIGVGFPVWAIGQPDPTYQWYRGASGETGSPIAGATSAIYTDSPTVDSMYWVKLTNLCGEDQLSGTALVVVGVPPHRRVASHNAMGLGLTDIMFRNVSTGADVIWSMTGGTRVATVNLPTVDTEWQAHAFADLNGDGHADVLWRYPESGQNSYWKTATGAVTGTFSLESMLPGWSVGASGDFANNGNLDLVWQNSVTNELQMWLMNQSTHTGTLGLGQLPSADWKLQGAADFDGDGKPDLMFRNYRTGANAIWHMEDTTPPGFVAASSGGGASAMSVHSPHAATAGDGMPGIIESLPDTNWRVASIDDVDGDGRPDIVWFNSATGELMAWTMYLTGHMSTIAMPSQTDPNLKLAGVPPVDIAAAPAPTALTVTATSTAIGGTTTMAASLLMSSTPVISRSVGFAIDGVSAGTSLTASDGSAAVVTGAGALAIGTHTATVTFNGDAAYAASSASTTFQVTPPPAQITWDYPASILAGTALSGDQLNATADVAGTFTYTPPAGTILSVGNNVLTVTFAPADSTARVASTATVVITVLPHTATLTWSAPAAITFGTPLGATQLNASADVAGTFVYLPPAGTVVHAGASQPLHVTFTPADSRISTASADVTISVAQAPQTINWSTPAAIVFGTALSPAQLNAKVSSGATLSYNPPIGTILGAGDRVLTASAAGTADYLASTATVTLHVGNAAAGLQWATPAAIVYGTPLSSSQLNATAAVPGTFVYLPSVGTVLAAGDQSMQVTFTPTDTADYNTAVASVTMTVQKTTPVITWTTPATIGSTTPLSSAQLNATANVAGTFTYTPAAGTVLTVGNHTLQVSFTPTDPSYNTGSASVTITVFKAK